MEPAAQHRGLILWFTGLSGAGKTTLCRGVESALLAQGCRVEVLDSDIVRLHLSPDLGFTREDREENVRRLGYVAQLLKRHGIIVLVAAISPYRRSREAVKEMAQGDFHEIYINAPLPVCEERDVKGLYQKARKGEVPDFTGIDAPYEHPLSPDLECRTDLETVQQSSAKILALIQTTFTRQERT